MYLLKENYENLTLIDIIQIVMKYKFENDITEFDESNFKEYLKIININHQDDKYNYIIEILNRIKTEKNNVNRVYYAYIEKNINSFISDFKNLIENKGCLSNELDIPDNFENKKEHYLIIWKIIYEIEIALFDKYPKNLIISNNIFIKELDYIFDGKKYYKVEIPANINLNNLEELISRIKSK